MKILSSFFIYIVTETLTGNEISTEITLLTSKDTLLKTASGGHGKMRTADM